MGLLLLASVLFAALPAASGVAIGIDLGTTYSCVAVYRHGKVEIIPNDQGNRITPSWIAFTPAGERLVGDAAKNQAAFNPANTVYDAKRLIGRKFDEDQVAGDVAHFPFHVQEGKDGSPAIAVKRRDQELLLSPAEVSALVLEKMKSIAEEYIGEEVTDAVITVPAYFNDNQRQATKDAGRIAGLTVLRVLNEPTAAAIAFGLDGKLVTRKVIVFDLGGGTFDVSLLMIDKGDFRVLATSGNTHLGGADFDQRVMDYFVGRFKLKHQRDLTTSSKAMAKLRREAERAKRALSSEVTVKVEIPSIMDDIDFKETLTRAKFEELCKDLFRQTVEPIQKVLSDTDTYPKEIDDVVLVGGSTRIPYIQKMVMAMFKNKKPAAGVNPDEAVAYGAAVQAAVLSGAHMKHNVALHDVTPLSLGIKTAGNMMSVLIKRNTPTPATKERTFSTFKDHQTMVSVNVYEGERTLVKDNHFLGKFDLTGIEPAPRGQRKIRVTFSIDEDGILSVEAYVVGHGSNSQSLTIDSETSRLSEADIKQMLELAEKHREQDQELKLSMDARSSLEQVAVQLRFHLSEPEVEALNLTEIADDIAKLEEALDDVAMTIDSMPNESQEFYEKERAKLTEVSKPITDYIRDALEAAALQEAEEATADGGEGEEEGGEANHEEKFHDEF